MRTDKDPLASEQSIRAPIGEAAARIAPGGVRLRRVVRVDDILAGALRMLQEPQHFGWRVLQIIIHGDDVRATRSAQARHHRIVLAKIARQIDQGDRHSGAREQFAAHLTAVILAAVVDQDDLVATWYVQHFKGSHQLADSRGAVIYGG